MIKSTHEGILKIGETEIPVAVLENGQRIITQSGVFQALDRPSRGNSRIDQIPTFMDAKNLQPYVNQDLMNVINKVRWLSLGINRNNLEHCHIPKYIFHFQLHLMHR